MESDKKNFLIFFDISMSNNTVQKTSGIFKIKVEDTTPLSDSFQFRCSVQSLQVARTCRVANLPVQLKNDPGGGFNAKKRKIM